MYVYILKRGRIEYIAYTIYIMSLYYIIYYMLYTYCAYLFESAILIFSNALVSV